ELLTVEDPAGLRARRARRHRGEVTARAGLAEQLAPQRARREDVGQPLLLLGSAVREQRGPDEVDADAADELRRACARELFDHDEVLDRAGAAPAVLLGPADADRTTPGQLALPLSA